MKNNIIKTSFISKIGGFNFIISLGKNNFSGFFRKYNRKNKNIILFIQILALFLIYRKSINKNIKICLCAIGKNENLYVREFVEHYKSIGYNIIFIYDNNDKYGERFEEVINDYIKTGFVEIINYRERDIRSSPQIDAYRDCYEKYNKLYDWLSFYDMDEFLELNRKYNTIQDFLSDKIFQYCQNIKINWLFYINHFNLHYENKSLLERMNHSLIFEDRHIKSTVRGNLKVNYWVNRKNPHTSTLNVTSCSSSGKIIKYDSPFNYPPDLTNAKLKHYYVKSFEEYCLKMKRGKADHNKDTNMRIIKQVYKKLYSENKNNSEKLKIIGKVFNESSFNFSLQSNE